MTTNSQNINEFNENWNFQKNYYSQVKRIIEDNALVFIKIDVADEESDLKRATDFVVRITGGDVAVRLRRSDVRYRDLTIRSFNKGYRTELDKIRDGFGKFYLYGWTNLNNIINEWVLIDLDKMRELKLFDGKQEIINTDGITRFIAIPIYEIDKTGCIVARNGL